jgi:hypothetical protein
MGEHWCSLQIGSKARSGAFSIHVTVWRANIILLTSAGCGTAEIMRDLFLVKRPVSTNHAAIRLFAYYCYVSLLSNLNIHLLECRMLGGVHENIELSETIYAEDHKGAKAGYGVLLLLRRYS